MVRQALRILLAVVGVTLLLAVTLMTDRSVPTSTRPLPREPLVRGRSEVIQPLPARPQPQVRRRVPHVRHKAVAGRHSRRVSFRTLLMGAVARIPGYHPGEATWHVTTRFGHWGVTDLDSGIVYISPRVPRSRVYDVAAHEWSHVLSVRDYDGAVEHALDSFNEWFAGHGLLGAERAADCMARLLGARWTNYTSCHDRRWRQGARRLLAGQEL